MRLKKYLCILVFTLFIANIAIAAPSIIGVTGTATDSSSIVISGSGFLEKSTPKPIRFDNFESCDAAPCDGDVLNSPSVLSENTTDWSTSSNTDALPEYSIDQAHSGSISAKCFNDGAYASKFFMSVTPYQGYVYATFWVRRNTVSGTMTNWKLIRIYSWDGSSTTAAPQLFNDCESAPLCKVDTYTEAGGFSNNYPGWTDLPADNTWERYEYTIYSGTPGESNGSFTVIRNGTTVKTVSGISFLSASSERGWDLVILNDYFDQSSGSQIAYYDDVYIDNVLSKIEIGNASTYAASNHKEIQIPSAWATGSITITVNRGSFGASDSAYLFVVDSDGNVSDGYPITFGETYGGIAAVNGGINFSGCDFH